MFKLDKKNSVRMCALTLSLTTSFLAMASCSKKETEVPENTISLEETVNTYETEKQMVNDLNQEIKNLFPELNPDTINNFTLITLLDELLPKDENGKINSDIISQFKSKIDSDNMMSDFNSVLDIFENAMIKENKVINISSILPEDMKVDAQILSKLEDICEKTRTGNKDEIVIEFAKLNVLFAEEDSLEIDGFEFEIRDLDYSTRAIAQMYARVALYNSRSYIPEELASRIDNRTNDQNNKAYIKTDLEIASNYIIEKSESDVIKSFNGKYVSLEKFLNGKVNISEDIQKDLVNYLNLEYLSSDKVSTKDKNEILGEYEDQKVSDVVLAVDAITTYNNKTNELIPFSELLVDEYKNTETGKIDAIALIFVQFNSKMLLQEIKEDSTFSDIFNNPYFQNLYKYLTKQDFTHKYKDESGNVVEVNIMWQEISDGANFINNNIILYNLNKLPKVDNLDSYKEKAQTNLSESIQYIQNTVTGECEKVDSKEFVKTK